MHKRKVILYIAVSLDGFIAGNNDDLSWLPPNDDYGYEKFLTSVDTVLLGRRTYDIAKAFDPWPYKKQTSIVFSRTTRENEENIIFTKEKPVNALKEILQKPGKDIWLCGGAQLYAELNDFIDEFIISIIPIILGEGIRLFSDKSMKMNLILKDHKVFDDGLVQLHYTRKR